jgi:hypothetical protein
MSVKHLPPFQHVRWNPDGAELRSFARSMLIGFAVLGGIAVLRHRGIMPLALGLWAAGLLLAAGALVPRLGRWVYLAVYVPTSLIGFVVSNVLLTAIFFLLFTPIGLLLRLLGKDLLRLRRDGTRSGWEEHAPERDPKSYYRTY